MRRSPRGSPKDPSQRPFGRRHAPELVPGSDAIEEVGDSPVPPHAGDLAREANRLEAAMWAVRQSEAVSAAAAESSAGEGQGLRRMWGGSRREGEGGEGVEVKFDPLKAAGEKRKVAIFLRILAVCMFVDASCLNIVPTLMPSLARALGLEQESIALLLGVRSFTAAALSLPTGLLLSICPHRFVLALAFLAATGGSVLLAWRGTWQQLALALFLQGAATQMVRSACASFAAHLFSPTKGPYESGFGGQLADMAHASGGQHQFVEVQLTEVGGEEKGGGGGRKEGGERVPRDELDLGLYGDDVVLDAMPEAHNSKEAGGDGKGSLVETMGVFYSWGSFGGVLGPIGGSLLYQLIATWLPFAILGGMSSILATGMACFGPPDGKGVGGGEGEQEASTYDRLREHSLPELTYPYRGGSKFEVVWEKGEPYEDKGATQGRTVSEAGGTELKKTMGLVDTLNLVARDRAGLVVLYVAGMQSMAWGIVEVVVPFFLQERCGLGTVEVGLAIGLNNLAYALTALFAGALVARLGSRNCVCGGLALVITTLPSICIIGFSCNFPLQIFLDFLMGIGFAMLETPLFALLVKGLEEYGSKLDYGIVMAIYQFSFSAGYAIAPFFAALLFLRLLSVGVTACMSILLIVGLLLWLLAIKC